jgi:hypothetical protein
LLYTDTICKICLYQQFFKFYEKLKNNSETHELVIAVGLFNYQQNNDTKKYCRHLIIQIADAIQSEKALHKQLH